MIKILACLIYPLLLHLSYSKTQTKEEFDITNHLTVLKNDNVYPIGCYQSADYDAISIHDVSFSNGIKSVGVSSITLANIEKILGKPKRIDKSYSEMDNDDALIYIYPEGDITFLVKQKIAQINVKGSRWSFGIKNNARKVQNFSPGDNLDLLKKAFSNSYQNPVNTVYINLGIKTSTVILSDSYLSFEVNKSKNKITSISLIQ